MRSLHRLQFKCSTMCGTGKLEQGGEALVHVGLGDVDIEDQKLPKWIVQGFGQLEVS